MVLLILILGFLFVAATMSGYRRIVRIRHLNSKRVFNAFLVALIILTLMTAANWTGLFSQSVSIKITMGLYTIAAGFFLGYGTKLITLRNTAGKIEYMYRSFWIDIAPNLISIALIVYGIYRTGILFWGPFTGIGITSGVSLIGFGFLGWTIHIVPEFRFHGILLLDQYLEWNKLITFEWVSENILRVEYFIGSKQISEFRTYIPPEDQSIIERILKEKMDIHQEERKKMLFE